jgi:hypothetical protein
MLDIFKRLMLDFFFGVGDYNYEDIKQTSDKVSFVPVILQLN